MTKLEDAFYQTMSSEIPIDKREYLAKILAESTEKEVARQAAENGLHPDTIRQIVISLMASKSALSIIH